MSHQSPPDSLLTDSAGAAEAAFKKFAVESWVLTSLAILICALRTYARVRAVGVKDLCLDDYMVWVGVACYTTLTSLAYCAGTMAKGLSNTGMTDAERTALSPIDVEYQQRVLGSKLIFWGWLLFGSLLWAFKASMLAFYIRLTTNLSRSYAIRIRIGFVFLASSYFTLVMTFFLSCRPFHKYWQINPNPGTVCQPTISTPLLWTNFVLNVSTDIYIMFIPIPLLWKSGLKIAKKIFMTILLGAGVFILACALLRVILVELYPDTSPQVECSWANRESFIASVVPNLPLILPLLKHWLDSVTGYVSLLQTPISGKIRTSFRTIGGGNGSPGHTARLGRRAIPSVNALPTNLTMCMSKEDIIGEPINIHDMKNAGDHCHDDHLSDDFGISGPDDKGTQVSARATCDRW